MRSAGAFFILSLPWKFLNPYIFIIMEIQLDIPDYLSVKQWKQFLTLEHLSESEKMITMVSMPSDRDWETII